MIGQQITRHVLNQSASKPKPIVPYSHTLRVLASNSDWFITLFASVSVVMARVIALVLVLQHSNENRSSSQKVIDLLFTSQPVGTSCSDRLDLSPQNARWVKQIAHFMEPSHTQNLVRGF